MKIDNDKIYPMPEGSTTLDLDDILRSHDVGQIVHTPSDEVLKQLTGNTIWYTPFVGSSVAPRDTSQPVLFRDKEESMQSSVVPTADNGIRAFRSFEEYLDFLQQAEGFGLIRFVGTKDKGSYELSLLKLDPFVGKNPKVLILTPYMPYDLLFGQSNQELIERVIQERRPIFFKSYSDMFRDNQIDQKIWRDFMAELNKRASVPGSRGELIPLGEDFGTLTWNVSSRPILLSPEEYYKGLTGSAKELAELTPKGEKPTISKTAKITPPETIIRLPDDHQELKGRYAKLQAEYSALQLEYDELKSILSKGSAQGEVNNSDLQEKYQTLSTKLAVLELEYNALQRRLAEADGESKQLQETNRELAGQLAKSDEMMRDLEARIGKSINAKTTQSVDPTSQYIQWVKENYPVQLITREVKPFIPPDGKEGKTLDMLARFLLYTHAGINVILNGKTGTGKTTLLEYVAKQQGEPLHTVPPVAEIQYRDAVGDLMEDPQKNIVLAPGPLTTFLIHGGYLGFDEMPNIPAKLAVAFHNVLQGKEIKLNTQYGPVVLVPKYGNHKIVGAGNFAYQKPHFNPATLQRLAFINVPTLPNELFEMDVKGLHSQGKPFGEYLDLLKKTHPWVFEDDVQRNGDYKWTTYVKDGNKKLEALTDMSRELREAITRFDEFGQHPDVSPATFKRVIALYSPNIGEAGLRDIVTENVINPIAVQFPHMHEERERFASVVYRIMEKYYSTLVPSKKSIAKEVGGLLKDITAP